MLREQGMAEGGATPKPTGKFWSVVGGASGGAMGFIFANFPGAVAVSFFKPPICCCFLNRVTDEVV